MTPKEMGAVIEALQQNLAAVNEALSRMGTVVQEQSVKIEALGAMCGVLKLEASDTALTIQRFDALGAELDERVDELTAHRAAHDVVLEGLTAKVEGRNRSAPTKRNMTDADALEVMTGKYKELDHKTAAEQAGLTYAQVYSARGEFTFKHVHKELREAGWKNPWTKK